MKKGLRYALVLAMIWPAAAEAQDWSNGYWSTTLPAVAGTDTLGLALRNRMEAQRRSAPARRLPPAALPRSTREAAAFPRDAQDAPDAPVVAADFHYKPSRERRATNLARFVDKSRAADPKGADNLAQLFAQGDIIERMRPELAKYGLRIDDVADAYTVWWINAWQASRGLSGDVSGATTASVRQQVMQSMASTPAFRNAGDATKQEMAESLLVQSLLLAGAVDQAKGNRTQLNAVSRAAVKGAQGMGVDLPSMTLTEEGFVPADQAGEARPQPGAQPAEPAQATRSESGHPSYALLAAAGGAGLGGMFLFGRKIGRKG